MIVWDGDILDKTDQISARYLSINNCGMQHVMSDHTCLRRHGRSDYHILLVTSGNGSALYRGEEYPLHCGSFILYPPHEEQRYTLKRNSSSFYCHFTGIAVAEILKDCGLTGGVYHGAPQKNTDSILTELIRRHFRMPPTGSENASMLDLLYLLGEGAACVPSAESDPLSDILAYIHESYAHPLTLNSIAEKAGYSKSRFSRIFVAATGKSPIRYLNDVRLTASCELLTATGISIAAVATACGFRDPLYYSRAFHAAYGESPTVYRERYKSQ